MSSLTENLSYIYSIKQEIKEVIGTNSDLFSEYPDLISDKLNEAIDWDDVATAGYIIPAGTITIDDNGSSIDVASYAYANVQVSGGSGSSIDPWYGESLDPTTAVGNEEFPLTADITRASITSDFTVNKTPNDAVESVEWLYQFYDTNSNLVTIKYIVETSHDFDGNDTGEIEVADRIAQSLEDYPDLYDILPSLTEVTMTQSSDPKTDGYDYLIEGNLYTWNLMNNTGEVMTITENGFVLSDGCLGYDVNVPIDWDEVASYSYIVPSGTITIGDKEIGNTVDVSAYANAYIDIQGGLAQGVPANVFVSIIPGLTGNSNYPYLSPNESEDGADQNVDTSAFVPFNDTYDAFVNVHTLISNNFPAFGIDPNDFVSSIRTFEAFDWDNGRVNPLSDLTCTTMLQEGNSNYDCWCLVEGTLQSTTDVCFKNDNGSWDDMSSQWSMDNNWNLMECMPVVEKYEDEYSPYGWSTSSTNDGTYISLPAGPVKLYLHYQESDGSTCDVYYGVYDSLNSQWTPKWYNMSETGAMTFVNPNA